MTGPETLLLRTERVVARVVAGQLLLRTVGSAGKADSIAEVSGASAAAWLALERPMPAGELVSVLCEEFGCTEQVAIDAIDRLRDHGLVETDP